MTGLNGKMWQPASAKSRRPPITPKIDHSVLRPSIQVSVTGMKQALMAAENGNKEVTTHIQYF